MSKKTHAPGIGYKRGVKMTMEKMKAEADLKDSCIAVTGKGGSVIGFLLSMFFIFIARVNFFYYTVGSKPT
jgi:hypothetical protein